MTKEAVQAEGSQEETWQPQLRAMYDQGLTVGLEWMELHWNGDYNVPYYLTLRYSISMPPILEVY